MEKNDDKVINIRSVYVGEIPCISEFSPFCDLYINLNHYLNRSIIIILDDTEYKIDKEKIKKFLTEVSDK